MKKQTNTLFATISKAQVENLTSIINETLATGFHNATSKIFTTVDLWNIQRQGRSRVQRRFSY